MFASLFTSVSNTAAKERRRAVRRRIDGAGELRARSAGPRVRVIPVVIRDLSATGVGIVHNGPLTVGEKFVVKQQEALPAEGPQEFTVVRSDSTSEGRYSIGLHASNLLDPRAAMHSRRRDGEKLRALFAVLASIVLILALAALMFY
jgi:hypothetical protein